MNDLIRREDVVALISEHKCRHSLFDETETYHVLAELIQDAWKIPNAETTGALDDAIQEYIKDGYILAEPNEYVKDGILTVQMPTMKEAKSIEKVVVYADTYKQEYSLPKVGEWIRTGRTNVYGGTELVCPFCDDHVMVAHIEDELYCRHCGALLGDRAKGEDDE